MEDNDLITITKEEYEELLFYKSKYLDKISVISNKKNNRLRKYEEMMDFDKYCDKQFSLAYKGMKKAYAEYKKIINL